MWDLIFNPFVTLLTWMYSILGHDIVLSIVVFTIIVRVVTYPLLAKQQQSTKKMQELQPRLERIKEKYKDDREKLAQAQMDLYREAGVNPFGGCLPLLIQFPILIALYQAIYYALANTPFQLVDLSERLLIPGLDKLIPLQNIWLGMNLTQPPTPPVNPTYALVLPVLVMATTYFQMKLSQPAQSTSSSSGQPNQMEATMRSMSTIMPIMFGAFALSFSVGLSVYFITSNLVGIAQYSPYGKRVQEWLFSGSKSKTAPIDDDDDAAPVVKKAAATASAGTASADAADKKTKKKKTRR